MEKIGCKHKTGTGNCVDKPASCVRNVNADLRDNVSEKLAKKKLGKLSNMFILLYYFLSLVLHITQRYNIIHKMIQQVGLILA